MSQTIHPDRTRMPQPAGFEKLHIREPKKITLDNGLPVYLIEGEDQEITRLDLVFDAGTAFQHKKLQAAAVNDLLGEGTHRHSSFQIAEILDFHGAYTDYFLTKDTAGITLYSLSKYYARLLPLMAELITEAVFPEEELHIYSDRRRQEYQINIQKVRYKASLEFNKLLFGEESAYGQMLEEEDFGKLTRQDLMDFYQKYYSVNHLIVILSGHIDDTLLQQVNQVLGTLPRKKKTEEPLTPPRQYISSPEQMQVAIAQEKALQSAIRLGMLCISRRHPDYPGLNLLNTVLGGYFGSRLMRSIREEKGYTYGVFSAIQNYRHADILGIATEVNASHTAEALHEIKQQIKLLCEEKIGEEELQTVKNYVYGSYLRSFDGPMQLADRFKKSAELDIPFISYGENLERMMQITTTELLETAQKYLIPEKMKTLVVGNTTSLTER
jgi:zinc protease